MEFIVGADRFDCCIITRHPGVHNRRTESCHFVFSVMAGGCCILSGPVSITVSESVLLKGIDLWKVMKMCCWLGKRVVLIILF